ncbi:MAG TPA: prepilin-type N-terminal cleavage/methylation domain-containing protein [Acidobacteriaceae bacterium]|nr:prepilin-type N-terminal cleavage/methylation domain-containing protein [Acidobacteriaceae bacterium]
MKDGEAKWPNGQRQRRAGHGFSMVELLVAIFVIFIVSAIAIIQLGPVLQNYRSDAAMREVLDQLRQAREYSIARRQYVQVTFPVVGGQYQVVTTQRNDLKPGAGAAVVLSTVPIERPVQFLLAGMPDTPDNFGNAAAIEFGGNAGGPPLGMLFQSDGELVDGGTYLPVNGSVFLAAPGQPPSTARAITVLGSTGRVRAWKSSGSGWVQF